jgi:hypothetical protein
MSFFTSEWLLPQKEHMVILDERAIDTVMRAAARLLVNEMGNKEGVCGTIPPSTRLHNSLKDDNCAIFLRHPHH